MSNKEVLDYIIPYIKATKVKGDPYILLRLSNLYIIDDSMSTLYCININIDIGNIVIANKLSILSIDSFNLNIYNMLLHLIYQYININTSLFKYITRKDNLNYNIPNKASDNSKLTIYYYNDNPTNEILIPEFYKMIPINKGEEYTISILPYNINEIIIRYIVYKNKPKILITIYRKIFNIPKNI